MLSNVTPESNGSLAEEAGRVGIGPASQYPENAPCQVVKVVGCLPSIVTFAFRLAALELHGKATTTTAQRRLQNFGMRQVRHQKESSAALIRKAKTAEAVRGTRHRLSRGSTHSSYQEAETNAG
jgi:hypothetical protein